MLVIDTNDFETIQEYEYNKKNLELSKEEKGIYEIDDFAMVRTTDFLDSDLKFKALCNIPFVYIVNTVPRIAINNILKEKNNVNIYDEDEYEKLKKQVDSNTPLSTQYRSTIHFTLNGLVSSHSNGNFDNQSFIVIDKLSKHLGKDDFRSIRMEDTFVAEEFSLSEDAIIMINYDNYQQIVSKNPWLNNLQNVVLFKGDEKLAVEIILTKMGIMPEKIEAHSSEYSKRTSMQQKLLEQVRNIYGIGQEKHCYSKEYKSDDEKSLQLWQIYNSDFYNKLFDFFKLEQERKSQMLAYLLPYKNSEYDKADLLKNYILEIGLENYQKFVSDYNSQILKSIDEGLYPNNKTILNSNSIELKEQRNKVL